MRQHTIDWTKLRIARTAPNYLAGTFWGAILWVDVHGPRNELFAAATLLVALGPLAPGVHLARNGAFLCVTRQVDTGWRARCAAVRVPLNDWPGLVLESTATLGRARTKAAPLSHGTVNGAQMLMAGTLLRFGPIAAALATMRTLNVDAATTYLNTPAARFCAAIKGCPL